MKNGERVIWISVVTVLLVVSLFAIFIKDASAGSMSGEMPYMMKFKRVFDIIKSDYVDESKTDNLTLINGAIKGMIDSIGDPHTNYLSEKEMSDMNDTSAGNFGGVGMIIQRKDDYTGVVSPIEGTPAYRKGMKAGDLIITVDGESIKGLDVGDVAKKLRGIPGTKVTIEVMRDDIKYETELVRAKIDVPSVKSAMLKDYGYIRISHFTGTTCSHVREGINMALSNNAKGLIIDLRYNPGGLLAEVRDIVDLFQDEGVIVSTKGRNYQAEVYKASRINTIVPKEMPVVVLVDGGSASASEIFSGAMKDLHRGILVGEKTYGKGSVQTIHYLGTDGMKLTIAKYYTPADICIDGIGIQPDIEVKEPELTEDEKEMLKKIFKDKAIENKTKGIKDASDAVIDRISSELINDGYKLPQKYLRKLVKTELEYFSENKPIYDLDYDIQLQKAVEILDNNMLEYKDGQFFLKN
ncbi:MAG: S41 family peptidase [Spirochaetales bacterium]|nr:S41 family peptidase [Spirochaetales bacterium]